MSGWIGSAGELLAPGWRKRAWRTGPCAACDRMVVTDGSVILDPEPTDDGGVVIDDHGQAAGATREDVLGRIPLWRAHFFSCPRRLVALDEILTS